MKKYEVGQVVSGKVSGIEKYGIFVLLENGLYGLIHISEVSDKFVKDIEKYAVIGDSIECEVIEYDSDNNRYKLSIKNIGGNKNKKRKEKIVETPSGFTTLQEKLDEWINAKKWLNTGECKYKKTIKYCWQIDDKLVYL